MMRRIRDILSSIEQKMDWLKLSPVGLLALLSCMNLLIYMDRGVIGSNGVNGRESSDAGPGTGIQGEFGINNALDGFLPGAFMVGLLVSSPIFAESSKHFNAFRLMAWGLGIWTFACAMCAFSPNFVWLVICRMLVGVGEASFVALAAPFIDDNAPSKSKTKWLAIFYLCIPTGYALGYIFGGLVALKAGWRGPFFIEALLMTPFLLYCLAAPALDIKGTKEAKEEEVLDELDPKINAVNSFFGDIAILLRHPVYVFSVLGSAVYTGVIGAYSYLGPKAGSQVFNIPGEKADLTFGAVTVLTGIFGTLAGGFLLDKIGSGVKNALIICSAFTITGCIAVGASFLFTPTLGAFLAPFAIGELALFGIQAPSNAISLWSVPPRLRPFAISMNIVVIHVLGDVPSPAILGAIQDRLQNWRPTLLCRFTMTIGTAFLILSAALFGIGCFFTQTQPDYKQTQSQNDSQEALETGEIDSEEGSIYDPLIPQRDNSL